MKFPCRFCGTGVGEESILLKKGEFRVLRTYVCEDCKGKVKAGAVFRCGTCGNVWLSQDEVCEEVIEVKACVICLFDRRCNLGLKRY
jgi:uncharacterized protein YlaI